jgi:hypothetical protein
MVQQFQLACSTRIVKSTKHFAFDEKKKWFIYAWAHTCVSRQGGNFWQFLITSGFNWPTPIHAP